MFTVYILYSISFCKTYVGFTSNLQERIKSHNFLDKKGWTKRYRPWIILHTEEFENKRFAMEREKFYKSGVGRDFIKELITEKGLSN